jgi:integrase/recombinase XerD
MVRPVGRPLARRAVTVADLREEFLAHCEARNLERANPGVVRGPDPPVRRLVRYSRDVAPSELQWSDLQEFVLDRRRQGFAPNTVHGYAQVLKTLCRLGHRIGLIPEDITTGFEMPRVPKTIVPTFTTSSWKPCSRSRIVGTWVGIRDFAILLVLLDTLIRVSELVGLDTEDVDLHEGVTRVLGKGGKERRVPFGTAAGQALGRYRNAVEDLRAADPFFITRYGRRMSRRAVHEMITHHGQMAGGIEGVRCSPHALRHTGGEAVHPGRRRRLTLQKLLGHTKLVMVRRYVELADVDVKAQHQQFSPAHSLLRRPRPRNRVRVRLPRSAKGNGRCR